LNFWVYMPCNAEGY